MPYRVAPELLAKVRAENLSPEQRQADAAIIFRLIAVLCEAPGDMPAKVRAVEEAADLILGLEPLTWNARMLIEVYVARLRQQWGREGGEVKP